MAPGSLGYIRAIAVLLSLFSLTAVWFGYTWGKRAGGSAAAMIAAGACAGWYELVYFAPKAFTEVMATNFLLPGLYLATYGDALPERKRFFWAGLLLGFAVSLRFQLAPAIGFAVLDVCHKNWRTRGPVALAGLLLPVVAFGLVDAITWSYPFQSFFLNVWVNLVEKRNTLYGTTPWYGYLLLFPRSFGPLLLLTVLGVRRSPFLGWITLIHLISHSFIPHKELRYMYPITPIVITLAALGFVEVGLALNRWRRSTLTAQAIAAAGLVLFLSTSALLAWRFPGWRQSSGGLIAMDRLSLDPSLCGVGVSPHLLLQTGGYAHLHQNVPIILIASNIPLEDQAPSFNALLTYNRKIGFSSAGCWNGVCLYRRAGSCVVSSQAQDVNNALRESGQ
jgi:hypothetical protein